MAKFGACITGRHVDFHDEAQACKGSYQKWVHVPARGKRKAGIEFLDETMDCDCSCHGNTVKKTTRRRRK